MAESRVSWIYLFHGEDELSSHEAVQGLVARMKDSPGWIYNVAFFEGERLSLQDLTAACQTVPFLSEKRLVVVTNLLSRPSEPGRGASRDESRPERAAKASKGAVLEGVLNLLPTVPEFCRLVFLEEQLISENEPLLKTIRALGGFVKAHRLGESGLVGWIRDRAARIGCKISTDAAEELAAAVGPNSRLLNNELIKLSTYCVGRAIAAEDVRALVADARKANVFAMVDAVGLRQPGVALRELRRLLTEGDHPLRVMAMLVRQFRLLIQVKSMSEAGLPPEDIARQLGVSPRGIGGLQRQARNFSFRQLESAYRRLLECDFQVKTGSREAEVALELLVAELLKAA